MNEDKWVLEDVTIDDGHIEYADTITNGKVRLHVPNVTDAEYLVQKLNLLNAITALVNDANKLESALTALQKRNEDSIPF